MAPNSLCARLLLARYCLNGDIMIVQEGPGISYSWRNIIRGIQALKNGIIWRVGDGEWIRIWEDPWIPRGQMRRPITPRGAILLTKVSELIDPITGSWDIQLLNDVFWEEDVKEIMTIPVRIDQNDFVAWHFDNKGTFSVKSAYHVLHDVWEHEAIRQKGTFSSFGLRLEKSFNWK